jgi:hypothetical protein
MTEERKHRWASIVFFAGIGLFFLGATLFMAFGPRDPAFNWASSPAIPNPRGNAGIDPDGRLLLRRDQPVDLKKLKLVYRGLQDGKIRIDVYILELDPTVPYAHLLREDEGRKGVRLGGRSFRLDSFSRKAVVLRTED